MAATIFLLVLLGEGFFRYLFSDLNFDQATDISFPHALVAWAIVLVAKYTWIFIASCIEDSRTLIDL